MRYLEDIQVGEVISSPTYVIGREEIIEVAQRWDPQPIHVDERIAKAGLFGDVIACTAHLFSILSYLCNQTPEEQKIHIIAGLGFDEGKTHKPVMPGDTLRMDTEIVEIRVSESNPDRGIMKWQHRMYNQEDILVFSMFSSVMMKCRG